MKQFPLKTIELSMTFNMQLTSNKKPLEQFGYALPCMVRDVVQELAWKWGESSMTQWLELNPGYRYVHKSHRKIVTPFGEIAIPDAEIRHGKKYSGRASQLVFGLEPKQRTLESALDIIRTTVTILSFRKSTRFLKTFWGKMSPQRLHCAWKSIKDRVPDVISVSTLLKRSYDVRRILAWLDGWVIRTRQCRGANVVRNTLRVVIVRITERNEKIWKATCGFLENSYRKLFNQVLVKSLQPETIVLCDGEKAIVKDITNIQPEPEIQRMVDPETGEVFLIKKKVQKCKPKPGIIAAIQRCVFHFSFNIVGKARSAGMTKDEAEALSDNLKALTYLRKDTMRAIKDKWEKVVMERISVLHWLCDELTIKKLQPVADSIRRAIPHLFTYVQYYCKEGFFIGRTTNKPEAMFRHATYRLKRIGAVWSPKGARQMLKFILADHLNYKFHPSVKPLCYQINCGVVKI